jgi:hypothetical protein
MTGLHESTLGLSVYNAIMRHGALTGQQMLAILQANWMPNVEASEVVAGMRYLIKRNLVQDTDGAVAARHVVNGAAAPVMRNPVEPTELLLVTRKAKKK